jgi:hypothetical protein
MTCTGLYAVIECAVKADQPGISCFASVLIRIASCSRKRQARFLIGYGLPGKTTTGDFEEIPNLR